MTDQPILRWLRRLAPRPRPFRPPNIHGTSGRVYIDWCDKCLRMHTHAAVYLDFGDPTEAEPAGALPLCEDGEPDDD